MKRLFIILLALCILMPITVVADEMDPIVGTWYMYYDSLYTPEFSEAFMNAERAYLIIICLENGTIYALNLDVDSDNKGTPNYYPAGKWEKTSDGYNYSILGFGESTAIIKDDDLYLGVQNTGVSARFQKMIYFNPYKDYIY